MNTRIKQLATQAMTKFVYPDVVPYYTENPKDAVNIGKALAEYIKLQPITLPEGEYLADRYRFEYNSINVPSEYYVNAFGERGRYYNTLCCNRPTDVFYWGWTHISLDYEYILNNGFEGYYNRIARSKQIHKNDTEKISFLEGMEYCLNGLIARYQAIAEYATELAESTTNEKQKTAWLRMADSLSRIPMKPAEGFFDAVQFTWITFLIAPDSLGRIDQYLYPFYQKDLAANKIDRDFAFELLEELFIKVYEPRHPNSQSDISGHNHLVVGGYLRNGSDGFNELSQLILEAIVDLPTYRPQASFRYTKKTSYETLRYITEMNKKSQLIVFVNDDPRLRGMQACGIAPNDAVDYTLIGCNEWGLPGKSKLDLTHVNLVHSLQEAIYNSEEVESYEKFYRIFEKELKKDFDRIIDEYAVYAEAQKDDLNILTSIFYDDCIENALPISNKGTRYYGLTMSFNGISNVADSLSVIKQFVYDEKRFTFGEIRTALKNNWVGFEDMRSLILKEGHFFGNDDDYVDTLAQNVANSIYATKLTINSPYIKNLIVGSFVGATNPNIIFGKRTKATPDGRLCGEEFTMGISQSQNKDKNGITALLKSIAKLDYSKLCGCLVSNLKMDKTMADTPEKLDRLAAVYHTFLKLGGMQLQINYLSTEELLDAQKNPENYQNLLVRVTGYSGFFTRFDTDLQNDIIKRTSQH